MRRRDRPITASSPPSAGLAASMQAARACDRLRQTCGVTLPATPWAASSPTL